MAQLGFDFAQRSQPLGAWESLATFNLEILRGVVKVAKMKVETMGVRIDHLTEEQGRYLASWKRGT